MGDTAGWVSLQPRDFYTLARPHPESLSKRKRNRKSLLGDSEEAVVVCLRLWVKVGVGPGPVPALPPHGAGGEARSIQDAKGRRKGTRSERLASRCPVDGARSMFCALHGTPSHPAPGNGAAPHSGPRGWEESVAGLHLQYPPDTTTRDWGQAQPLFYPLLSSRESVAGFAPSPSDRCSSPPRGHSPTL